MSFAENACQMEAKDALKTYNELLAYLTTLRRIHVLPTTAEQETEEVFTGALRHHLDEALLRDARKEACWIALKASGSRPAPVPDKTAKLCTLCAFIFELAETAAGELKDRWVCMKRLGDTVE